MRIKNYFVTLCCDLILNSKLFILNFLKSHEANCHFPNYSDCPASSLVWALSVATFEPEDVVVLDATKANELQGVILFYPAQDKMIVVGEEMRLSDLEGVMSKNMATPYTIDEYAVVIATKDPLHPTIQLRVGYDGGLAGEIAAEIDKHILKPA